MFGVHIISNSHNFNIYGQYKLLIQRHIMNKKIVTLILVILVSFCFLSIVVADNVTNDDNNTTDHNSTIDNDNHVDKNKTSDKNKTDDKSKKNYILAKGKGNNIKFSDGFRGFILDYSKSPASSGDEFKHVSTSKASNSNTLKLAIIECYKQNSTDQIGKIMADFVKTGSSNTKVGEAVAASHEKVSDHEVVKINKHTEAVFDFEVLKSVSGNESDYFAYKVSFKKISDDEKPINHTNYLTNVTNATNVTNTTNRTNTTNVTNLTNITNMTLSMDNETNATFLQDLYDYLAFLANMFYDAWQPIIDTLINDFLMMVNAFEELTALFEEFMAEIQSLMDALGELLNMLESISKELEGLLKLLGILLTAIGQLLNLLGALWNFIVGLISSIISLIQQLIGLLSGLINFLLGLINQLSSLIQAIFAFLNSVGSALIKVIENAAILITTFVIIAFGAFVYNRIR